MTDQPAAEIRYVAFISYSHADATAAKWLHRNIERFRIDTELIGRDSPLGPIPKTLSPVFRDRDDFTAGHSLSEQTIAALDASAALIVICSPAAAASHYVNEEIRLFRQRHPGRPVIPLIVAGKPGGGENECFPPALRFQVGADGAVTDEPNEVLAADWREEADGNELALAKIVARLLGLSTDDVFRRAERARRRANRIRAAIAAMILALAATGGITTWLWQKSQVRVVSYDAALDRYCQDYLKKFRTECDHEDLQGTFKRIAEAAAGGRDPRNAKILKLIAEGRSDQAAVLMRELAAEEAARGKAQIKRAAQRYRDSGQIAFLKDTKAAMADYRRAVELDPDHPDGWNRLGALQLRIGALDAAVKSFETVLALAKKLGDKKWEAAATGNLGLIYMTRGELARAEEMYKRALKLAEELGNKEQQAAITGNLGLIYQTRGELDHAEAMQLKSLKLEQELGRKEGMANATGNLGAIYLTRGELARAEEMYKRALKLAEELGNKEQQAAITGNLGLIYRRRGELDLAEAMHKRDLDLSTELGSKEGQARATGNLGLIYKARGELDRAEAMQLESLKLDKELGRKEGMAASYGNLGLIYQTRGELDRAEAMFLKILNIHIELGAKEGIASDYGNLGSLYKQKGDMARACKHWGKSRDLFRAIGSPTAQKVEGWMRKAKCGNP